MELRSTLGNTLLQILRAVAQQQLQLGTLVVKTLSISVVAVALRTANGPTTQVGEALSIGSAGTVPAVHVSLQMLQQMPGEVEKADINRQRRNELCAEMGALLPSVIQFCGHVLAGSGQGSPAEAHSATALDTNAAWVKLASLPLSALAMSSDDSRAVFQKMLQLLAGQNVAVAVSAAKALEATLIRHEDPSEQRNMAINALRDALLATRPLLAATAESIVSGEDADEAQTTTHALACLFVVFASRQLPQLIGVESATPANVEFMELFMRLSGHPYRRMALLTQVSWQWQHGRPLSELLSCSLLSLRHSARPPFLSLQDVWLEVSDLSLAERAPAFREPVNAQLLEVLLQQCTYPEDYEGDWDAIDTPGVDEFVFKELRGDVPGVSGTGDAFINCFTVLKHNFLMALVPRLQHRAAGGQLSWNTAESALYALQAVSGSSDIGGGVSVELAAPPQLLVGNVRDKLIQQQHIRELLLGVLEYVTYSGDDTLRRHPLLLNAGAGMIGAYASLLRLEAVPLHTLGYESTSREVQEAATAAAAAAAAASGSTEAKNAPALLMPALEYIGAAIAVPLATKMASRAFRLICVDSAASTQVCMLVARTGGEAFAAFLAASVAAGGTQEDREKIVEGATRVISQLVSNAQMRHSLSSTGKDPIAVAGEAILRFATPLLLDTLSSAAMAAGGGGESPRSESVVEALGLVATMIKFLDMPSATVASSSGASGVEGAAAPGGHVALPLLSALLPLLEALTRSPAYSDDDRVASGVFRVFGEAFKNLPTLMHQHLSPLVQTIVQAFEKHRWPAALDCVYDSVNAFGSTPGSEDAFLSLLGHLTQHTVAHLQSAGHSPAEEPVMVQSYFNMLKGYIIFCPLALLRSSTDTLAVLFGAAVACVECITERDSLRAVLLFVGALLKLKGKADKPHLVDAYNHAIHPLVASEQGQRLLRGLLTALAGGAAASSQDAVAECATTLVMTLTLDAHPLVQGWVVSVLSENEKCRELDDGYRHRFLNALVAYSSGRFAMAEKASGQAPRNPRGLLRMTLQDFGKVCTGEKSTHDCQYE